MQIKINDNYIIKTDAYNYTLFEIKQTKKGDEVGKEYLDEIGYFSTLAGALYGCAEKGIMKSDLIGVQEICQRLDELKSDIMKAVKGIAKTS